MSRGAVYTSVVSINVLLFAGLVACNRGSNQAAESNQAADYSTGDPASGNLAPVSGTVPAPAPETAEAPAQAPENSEFSSEAPVEAPEPPPPLPDYMQPPCPGDNYLWTPGYWNYASAGYYWVPGAWVLAPWVGALWTPPWWGYQNGAYVFHTGYWGPHIGFYGDIDYGFGYTGRGYYGAYWNRGTVYYNRSVTVLNTNSVHNVYNYAAPANRGPRTSYNGGRGGIEARPTPQESAAARFPRTAPVAAQTAHVREASLNHGQFATAGRAAPAALAASRPLTTAYKAPEAKPPEAAVRAAAHPAPETRSQPQLTPRPAAPQAERSAVPNRPEPQPAQRPEVRPTPQTQARPELQQRPVVPRPESQRQAAPHPEPQRAAPAARPEPQRAAPAPRPEPQRQAAPRPAPQQKRPEENRKE